MAMRRSVKQALVILGLGLLGVALLRPVLDFLLGVRGPGVRPGQSAEEQLSLERRELLRPEQVVKVMNPPPGGTVLDLGAGYGLFTFPLAKTVGEEGKVFATDVERPCVAYLKEHAARGGMRNVIPVLVSREGLDPFYTQHVFDAIVIFDVLQHIEAPEVFFAQLRPSLRKGSGRLWIALGRIDPDFTALEFPDPAALRAVLLSERVNSTIGRRLGTRAHEGLAASATPNDTVALSSLVIADLNRMLEDPSLWPEAQAGQWPLNAREERFRQYIGQRLEEAGVFSSGAGPFDGRGKEGLRLLNRLVIQDILGSYRWERAFSFDKTDWSAFAPVVLNCIAGRKLGQDCARQLGELGYELVQEHTALPYYLMWEFRQGYSKSP